MKTDEKVVVLCSGGLNSVTLAYQIHSTAPTPEIVLFGVDYGQRHKKELYCAKQIVKDLVGVTYVRAHVEQPIEVAMSSALFKEGAEVPDGHYEEDSMKVTVVPNRNAILLSLAWAHAIAIGATTIYAATPRSDHSIYPDCRPWFINALSDALAYGTDGHADLSLKIVTPYIRIGKHNIIRIGATQLKVPVPYEKTWSCFKGGVLHCGTCGACAARKEAFELARIEDPTEYEDYTLIPSHTLMDGVKTRYEDPTPVPDDITLNFGANF